MGVTQKARGVPSEKGGSKPEGNYEQACNYAVNALCYRCFSRYMAKIYRTAFFLIYAKQKPVEYSPGGAFDLLMLVVMKELKGVLEIFKERGNQKCPTS